MSEAAVSPGSNPWRHWQMAAFDVPPAAEVTAADASAASEAAREAARVAGFAAGRQAGFEAGRADGHAAGLASGLDEGRASGHAAGHAEGYAAGLAAGQTLMNEHAERLRALLEALASALRSLEEDVGQALLALALELARQIVNDTLVQRPEAMLACVREVLALAHSEAAAHLWLHPDDLALVENQLAEALRDGDWRVLPDATLARGGCRAETAFGTIDATLTTRWRKLATSLLGDTPSCSTQA